MYKPKPRCTLCGRKLKDGKCINPKCIEYIFEKAKERLELKKKGGTP